MEIKKLFQIYEVWRAENYFGGNGTRIKDVPELLKSIRDLGFTVGMSETEDICEFARNEHIKKYSETISVSAVIKKEVGMSITRPVIYIDVKYNPISDTTHGVSDSKTVYPGEGCLFLSVRSQNFDIVKYNGGDGDDRVFFAILDEVNQPVLWTFDWETFLEKEPKYELFFDDVNTDGAFLLKRVKE